jgi:translation initiation factor eIF-2B subunit delta
MTASLAARLRALSRCTPTHPPARPPAALQGQASRAADAEARPELPAVRTEGATTEQAGARTPSSAQRSPKPQPTTPVSGSAPAAVSSFQATAAAAESPPSAGAVTPPPPHSAEAALGHAPAGGKPAAAAAAAPEQRQSSRPQQKVMTKAERRALQEAQRAAKAGGGGGGGAKAAAAAAADGGERLPRPASSGSLSRQAAAGAEARPSPGGQPAPAATDGKGGAPRKPSGGGPAPGAAAPPAATAELFSHLPPFRPASLRSVADSAAAAGVPLDCVRLGLQMADGSVRGTSARCAAMLELFLAAAAAFKPPPGRAFAREFGGALNAMVSFLVACRPLSPAAGNVVKAVKASLERIKLEPGLDDAAARARLGAELGAFLQEKVRFAREAVARAAGDRVQDGDVVLTFAHSSAVEGALLAAAARGARFSAVVVDARPLLEGRRLLRRLLAAGVPCEYLALNSLAVGLSAATKVVLGAAAVLSNGAVVARAGTAAVAMAAAAAHVPVLVCAETYKFHERVQLDSVTHNELGDPAALVAPAPGEAGAGALAAAAAAAGPGLSLLNLTYDTTPAEFVSVVVTELGALPPSSVPVVLREYRREAALSAAASAAGAGARAGGR